MIEIKNLTTVIITLILSILLAYVSFAGGASEAYLFPKNYNFNDDYFIFFIFIILFF